MAMTQAFSASSLALDEAYVNFKLDLQDKLQWTEERWLAASQKGSDRYYFCRGICHWFRKLIEVQDLRFVVLTTFSTGSQERPSFREILEAYKLQFGLVGLLGASQSINPNFVILLLENSELRSHVLQKFTVVKNSFVVNSEWLLHKPLIPFQLNGLPPDIALMDIQVELEKFVPVMDLRKEVLDLGGGDFLSTGKVFGNLSISDISSLDLLPYFIRICRYNSFWIIYQRQPLCFGCKLVGHLAPSCPTPLCYYCRECQPKSHQCSKAPDKFISVLPDLSVVIGKQTNVITESLKPLAVVPNLKLDLLAPAIKTLSPHPSWFQEDSCALPSAFAEFSESVSNPYCFQDSLDSPIAVDNLDPRFFSDAMDSLRELQEKSAHSLLVLKSLPVGAKAEKVRSVTLPSPMSTKQGAIKSFPGTDTDPAFISSSFAAKKHSKKKK